MSHRCWREGLVASFSEYQFTELVLPPRYFSWRIRGNGLSFAETISNLSHRFDLVLATSMVDLSTLKGICPHIAHVPSILYFHENQFEFPLSEHVKQGARGSIEPQMVNLYAALAADHLLFNSEFNLSSFLSGVDELLKKMPDFVPQNTIQQISDKASIVPVGMPLDLDGLSTEKALNKAVKQDAYDAIVVVWNHRWEYDKGPERLLNLVKALPESGAWCFHIVGQTFSKIPSAFDEIHALLIERGWLGQWGTVERREDYIDLLRNSDIVLSTSLHDFQGLSILEAIACGCEPLVPNRLAYPEYVPRDNRYTSSLADASSEANFAAAKLLCLADRVANQITDRYLPPTAAVSGFGFNSLSEFSWSVLKARYKSVFERTAALSVR